MNLPREWTLFLGLVDDLLNECECRMSSQDYSACESLLTRLHSTRNGCKRVACTLDVTAENPRELETISKIKFLSDTLQGVIDCFEKKLYEIDMSSYESSWLPESLVLRTGVVGRPQLVVNLGISSLLALFMDKNCFHPLYFKVYAMETP